MYSLRRVLAVRFSVTLFIALSLIALWATIGVRHTLKRQIDQSLSETLDLQEARLASGVHLPPLPAGIDFFRYFEGGNRLVVLRDAGGRIVEATGDSLDGFPLDTGRFLAALNGRTVPSTESWKDRGMRTWYGPAPSGSPPPVAVVEVAASLTPLADTIGGLLRAMIGIVLLGTFAVGMGAFWLAGAAVAPVSEVSAQAQALDSHTLARRITAHTDVVEFQSLITVLNQLLERTERAFAAQRRLTADLGHELRTPLTALRGGLEIALRSARAPEYYQKVLRSGLEEIDELTDICDSLLLINRLDASPAPIHRTATDMNDVVLHSLTERHDQLEQRNLHVTTKLNYDREPALLDPHLTSKMIDELLQNAVKFSPPGGDLSVGTEGGNNEVMFWVEDSGTGIAPEHLPHLFEPFFQADEARVRGDGPGLGLTLAASIARAHGGTITATNLAGRGARFEVRLPAMADHAHAWSPVSS
jgi:signal transduction histidine kinase